MLLITPRELFQITGSHKTLVSRVIRRPCPEVIKLFFHAQLSWAWNFLLISMKMPIIVGIFILISKEIFMLSYVTVSKKEFAIVSNLRFICRTNFMLSWVEHEKSFITSGSGSIYTLITHIWPKGSFDPLIKILPTEQNIYGILPQKGFQKLWQDHQRKHRGDHHDSWGYCPNPSNSQSGTSYD